MVNLTERAAEEVRKIGFDMRKIEGDNGLDETMFLRAGVKGGGCSGFQYSLDLIDADGVMESDETFEYKSDAGNVTVVVDSKSNLYMDGTVIDFNDEIMGRGFVFNNPNASSSCGCGQSFSC